MSDVDQKYLDAREADSEALTSAWRWRYRIEDVVGPEAARELRLCRVDAAQARVCELALEEIVRDPPNVRATYDFDKARAAAERRAAAAWQRAGERMVLALALIAAGRD